MVSRVMPDHRAEPIKAIRLAPVLFPTLHVHCCKALTQGAEADGLEQAIIHARAQAFAPYLGLCVGGIAQDRAAPSSRPLLFGAYRRRQLVAVHVGHVAIEHQHVEVACTPGHQAFATVRGRGVLQPEVTELLCHQLQVGRVIIDHQYVEVGVRCLQTLDCRCRSHCRISLLQRHLHPDLGAQAFQALDAEVGAHHFAECTANGKAQARTGACPLTVRVRLNERIEQPLYVVRVDTDAAVTHLHVQQRAGAVCVLYKPGVDAYLAVLGELDGIAHQIGQHLLEAQGV